MATTKRRPLLRGTLQAFRSRYPSRILVVDDDPAARAALRHTMESFGHSVIEAGDGIYALARMHLGVDLVLVDAEMPGLDGFGFVELMRDTQAYDATPVIMVTGYDSHEDRLRAVAGGINDFIGKPFDIVELSLRSEAQLKLKAAREAVARQRDSLEREVTRRTAALRLALDELRVVHEREREAHLATIRALVLAAEYKDEDTASHIERISGYSRVLAEGMGLPPEEVDLIALASPLHDVGKIGVPDSVLLKPGPLEPHEVELMRRHPEIGARLLEGAHGDVLRAGSTIAVSHHEKWDGSGYPGGLEGEEIPLWGRICAVADVFDALSTNRRYRRALPNEQVYQMMREGRGTHFDPAILDVFFGERGRVEEVQEEFRAVAGVA